MKRNATAVWNGSGKEGGGHLTTQSSVLNKNKYSWASRFENSTGTNPEELIAAAHAGCFSMKLSFVCNENNFTPEVIETTCTITIEDGTITESHLKVNAKVPGTTAEQFEKMANEAMKECPISKALNMKITMQATLMN